MKRRTSVRRILPASAVVAAVLIAAFMNFSMPRMERLRSLERECEALVESGHMTPATASAVPFREPVEVMESVTAANAASGDPAVAYDRLLGLARGAGLQVESITPNAPHVAGDRFESSSWTLVATGPFGAAVTFVDALETASALHRVESIRLVPAMAGEPNHLTLTVSIESVRIVIPEALVDAANRQGMASAREGTP